MAEEKKNSFFNDLLGYADRLGSVYSRVELARQGVPTPPATVTYETRGANDPVIAQGQQAAVYANDPLADALREVGGKAAGVAAASEARKMMPMILGGMALGITIYLLTKK